MMVFQIHPPSWEIHIVVILFHLAKSLPATTSSFIFILIIKTLELDSNWNIMQQVRIYTKQILVQFASRAKKKDTYLNRFLLAILLSKLIPQNHTCQNDFKLNTVFIRSVDSSFFLRYVTRGPLLSNWWGISP